MGRSLYFFLLLWLSLILSILLFLIFPFFYLPFFRKYKSKYIRFWTSSWASFSIFLSGSRIHVKGIENIPSELPFAIVSNHQGYMDIPILMTVFPWPLSFVAKKELLKVPIINLWILALDCIILDREKPFDSFRRISERLQRKGNNPVIIFPEGTRSRGKQEGKWKQGGIKLIKESGIPIVKVKIEGSYKIWEEKSKISSADIQVEIYPADREILS